MSWQFYTHFPTTCKIRYSTFLPILYAPNQSSLPEATTFWFHLPQISFTVLEFDVKGFFFSMTLCDPMDRSTPGFPVLHHLLEFVQTDVCWVDAIQPSHSLLSPSPPAFNLSQHPGLFQWVGSSHQVVKLLELQLLLNIQGWFPLGLTGFISLLFKGLSRVFFNTTIWKHQFFGAQPSLWSNSHICRVKTMVFLVVLHGYGREALDGLNFSWLKPTRKW